MAETKGEHHAGKDTGMDEGKNCRNEIDKKCAARTELQMSDDDDERSQRQEKKTARWQDTRQNQE